MIIAPLAFPHIIETAQASSVNHDHGRIVIAVAEPVVQTEVRLATVSSVCNRIIEREIRFDKLLYSGCDLHIGIQAVGAYSELSITKAISATKIVMAPIDLNKVNFAHPITVSTTEPGLYLNGTLLHVKMAVFSTAMPSRYRILTQDLYLHDRFSKLNMLRC